MAHAAGCGLQGHSFNAKQRVQRERLVNVKLLLANRLVRQAEIMPRTLGGAPNSLQSPEA